MVYIYWFSYQITWKPFILIFIIIKFAIWYEFPASSIIQTMNDYVIFLINIDAIRNSLWQHIWINLSFWQNFLDSGISFSILAAPRAPAARSYFLKIDSKKIWLLPSFSQTRYCARLRDQIWRDWTDNYRKEVSYKNTIFVNFINKCN